MSKERKTSKVNFRSGRDWPEVCSIDHKKAKLAYWKQLLCLDVRADDFGFRSHGFSEKFSEWATEIRKECLRSLSPQLKKEQI